MSTQKKHNSTNKKKKSLTICDVHIHMTFNNIIASITNIFGDVAVWSSAGKMGFKGSRRSTPFAAKVTIQDAMKAALDLNMRSVRSIVIKGICNARESAIREVFQMMNGKNMPPIEMIKDVTPVPHNGTKPPKKRRV